MSNKLSNKHKTTLLTRASIRINTTIEKKLEISWIEAEKSNTYRSNGCSSNFLRIN